MFSLLNFQFINLILLLFYYLYHLLFQLILIISLIFLQNRVFFFHA